MGSGAPSGTVTFLFTDIEGSTGLWEADPDAMRMALERHDSILRATIDGADGYVFSTGGDGLAAAFARAGDAVTAAVEAQQRLTAETWPGDGVLRVRMGLHTGETAELPIGVPAGSVGPKVVHARSQSPCCSSL